MSGACSALPQPLLQPYRALLDTATLSVFILEIERCDSAFRDKLDCVVGRRGAFLSPRLSKAWFPPMEAPQAWSLLSQDLISLLTTSDKPLPLREMFYQGDRNAIHLSSVPALCPISAEFTGRSFPFWWEQLHSIHLRWNTSTLVRSIYPSAGVQ